MAKKTMWFPPSPFGVDAGNVGIMDEAFVRENDGDPAGSGTTTIKVKPGKYKVRLLAKDTYKGRRQITRVVEVKGNALIVGDICYSFSEVEQARWLKFLEDTNYFKDMKRRGAALDTGGDGEFDVEVFVTPL